VPDYEYPVATIYAARFELPEDSGIEHPVCIEFSTINAYALDSAGAKSAFEEHNALDGFDRKYPNGEAAYCGNAGERERYESVLDGADHSEPLA